MENKKQRYTIKDSGTYQEYDTGSRRDNQAGKGRYDLISPIALERLAQHYEAGAAKYEDRNWEKGQPISRFIDATLRHINKWRIGYRDEDHIAAAVWNLMGLIHVEHLAMRSLLPKELVDHPQYLTDEELWELFPEDSEGSTLCPVCQVDHNQQIEDVFKRIRDNDDLYP